MVSCHSQEPLATPGIRISGRAALAVAFNLQCACVEASAATSVAAKRFGAGAGSAASAGAAATSSASSREARFMRAPCLSMAIRCKAYINWAARKSTKMSILRTHNPTATCYPLPHALHASPSSAADRPA